MRTRAEHRQFGVDMGFKYIGKSWLTDPLFIKSVANAVMFQAGWWLCILGPTEAALIFTVVYVCVHAKWLLPSNVWQHIVRIIVIGCAMDSFLAFSGVLNFGEQRQVIPLWLVCIWVMFAPCFFLSLRYLSKLPLVAAATGAIGGSLAYFGGAMIHSGVQLGEPLLHSVVILAVVWALFFPLVFAYVNRDGVLTVKGHS